MPGDNSRRPHRVCRTPDPAVVGSPRFQRIHVFKYDDCGTMLALESDERRDCTPRPQLEHLYLAILG
jgi:hypothetical protein